MEGDELKGLRDSIVGFLDGQYADLFDWLIDHRDTIDPSFVADAIAEKMEDAQEEPELNGIRAENVPRLLTLIAEIQGLRDAWWTALTEDDEE